MIETEDDLRRLFWETFPDLSDRKITDYSGNGLMYCTDTRCAWVDFVDMMQKDGQITEDLAQTVTLDD